jgi:hypothetical protein
MEVIVNIPEGTIKEMFKKVIDEKLIEIDIHKLISDKMNFKVDNILKLKLSEQKIENFAKDRISRIITNNSLKEYTPNILEDDVLANVESKILLMIQHSKDFKSLVKSVLKASL